ncbi:hypothetical protein Tco_0842169 [Tanacetum coccineum]|uniref:Uncharacterized protein n=1 Tax=Tanacetum coccineum TaxID=301880 RepID=A0ABQ5B1Z4_9ASTR
MVKMPRCMSFPDSTNAYDEPIGIHTSRDLTVRSRRDFRNNDKGRTFGRNATRGFRLEYSNNNISLSSKEIPSVDEPEPQLLPNSSPLDVNLGDKRGTDPPINPDSPCNLRLKVVDQLTIHIPHSPHVAYYHSGLGDPKKHYRFNPGLIGHSGSLSVDFSNLKEIEDHFLGEGLSLPMEPKELENG